MNDDIWDAVTHMRDHVIYGAFAGEDIEVEEKGKKVKYKLLDDEDVIAFIK